MPETEADVLTAHYRSLQRNWLVSDGSQAYGRLVVPNGNSSRPFHRWFHLKEAYSATLLPQILSDYGTPPEEHLRVFDPFSGSGTTLLSAVDHVASNSSLNVSAVGVERNPFLWELGIAKLQGRILGSALVDRVDSAFDSVIKRFKDTSVDDVPIPEQSTINNAKYFPRENVQDLVALRYAIADVDDTVARSILRVCLASSVEPCGQLRRDGRALRYAPQREPRSPLPVFTERISAATQDLTLTEPSAAFGDIHFGDGRNPPPSVGADSYDWIVFSPPYPNNIDYTEVYKTEAWILGCYDSAQDMRNQRLSTIRSHPSVRFDLDFAYRTLTVASEVDRIVEPIVNAIPDDRYATGRREVIRGYADDMFSTLRKCRDLIAKNGRLVFIVGNSAHGSQNSSSFVIAADVVMGALAELTGWRVQELKVARQLKRRTSDSEFLRESVVVLQPV
ncbi:hypothetical protein ACIQRZ_02225 [Streptomyces rubiginosohelvolus]|uniref:hypothetical protein n=1 Tax=Streptomyces rubiginosohelvolus TaxID=67362 RepID=UPI00381384C9